MAEVLNGLLGWAEPLAGGRWRLDPERILEDARARTGEDLAMPEGLPVIADAAASAGLTPLGRLLLRVTLDRVLRRLAGLQRAKRDRALALAQPLRKPLIVTGLHRTGTTTLQRLLALDPSAASLPLWLTLSDTLPDGRAWRAGMRRERRFGRFAAWFWNALSPEMRAVHPTSAELPEEELEILLVGFNSPALYFRTPIHRYLDWSLGQDAAASYDALRFTLLALQEAIPGERWVLKCPTHLATFGALLAGLPEADIVVTHRDPVKALPSFIHMVEVLQAVSHPAPRSQALVERLRRFNEVSLRELEAHRGAHERRILDLPFPELVADPVAAVRRIYERFGYPFSAAFEDAMRRSLAQQERRSGPAAPGPEAYGLTPDGIRAEYADYVARYLTPGSAR